MIGWVEEEHEIMSYKSFFKPTISEKIPFWKLKKLLILIALTSIHERFTECVSDWGILNNDWLIQKNDLLTSIWRSLCHIVKYLTHAFPDL